MDRLQGRRDKRGFVGHFDTLGQLRPRHPGRHPRDPAAAAPLSLIDARVALSSSCTADPFSKDGTACTPGDVNAAFHTFTTAGAPQRLFAQADIGGPNCVLFKRCELDVHVHGHHATIDAHAVPEPLASASSSTARPATASSASAASRSGTHHKGRLRLHWNLKVHGKRLHSGRYRITLRALDKQGQRARPQRPATLRIKG